MRIDPRMADRVEQTLAVIFYLWFCYRFVVAIAEGATDPRFYAVLVADGIVLAFMLARPLGHVIFLFLTAAVIAFMLNPLVRDLQRLPAIAQFAAPRIEQLELETQRLDVARVLLEPGDMEEGLRAAGCALMAKPANAGTRWTTREQTDA